MDEINIAIVDDDIDQLKILSGMIEKICHDEHSPAKFFIYDSGSEMVLDLDSGTYFDIVFLDIEMPDPNGIEIGHLLRSTYNHEDTIVIFISAFTKYFQDLFSIHPYDFVKKPTNQETLREQFVPALDRVLRSREIYEFSYSNNLFVMPKNKILYLESKGKYINVVYNEKETKNQKFLGAIKIEASKFKPPDFVVPHASFIVNLKYFSHYTKREFKMVDGKTIPIAYTKSALTQKAIMRFIKTQK